MIKIRSGLGYDIHRLKKGNGLYVGGVKISDTLMAVAHSDGDVLIHSLIDALLGAMGKADIGELFPDNDPQFKGIASLQLLDQVKKILDNNNFEILNIDCVVVIQTPKISPFKNEMKNNIAAALNIPQADFNVKAKTKENIGAVGRGEAIECFSTVLIRSKV
jgi:2-C-methyl-D-erythritol 2,4-cyclodiphosphate synthase